MAKTKKSSAKKIHVALQGGGAHGAFTWGVLDKLLQECEKGNLEIGNVTGTSAGAMNGTVLVHGLVKGGPTEARKELKKFWRNVSKSADMAPLEIPLFKEIHKTARLYESLTPAFFQPMVKHWNDMSLALFIGLSGLARPMAKALPNLMSPYDLGFDTRDVLRTTLEDQIDFEALRKQDQHKLYVSATDVETGDPKHFTGDELCADALIASACLPELFKAVEINGKHYWDGGYSSNPTLLPLIYNESTEADMMVVQLSPSEREGVPTTVPDIKDRTRELGFISPFKRAIRQIELLNSVFKVTGKPSKDFPIGEVRLHVIGDKNHLSDYSVDTKLQTEEAFIDELFQEGQKAATEWLKDHFNEIGVKSSYSSAPDLEEDETEKLTRLILGRPSAPRP